MRLKPDSLADEDKKRIIAEYDNRHADCDDEECNHATATEEDKLLVDSNNRVGAIALFSNSLSSVFNLLGVMVIATAPLVTPLDISPEGIALRENEKEHEEYAEKEIGRLFSLQFFLIAVLAPTVVQTIWSRRKWLYQKIADKELSLRDRVLLLLVGIFFASTQFVVSAFLGPELPCLLAGGVAMLVFILFVRGKSILSREWPAAGESRRYLLPFILLIVVLMIIRLIPDLESYLTGEYDPGSMADTILSPKIAPAFSKVDFPWLVHPGIIVVIIALLTPLIVPYKDPDEDIKLDYPPEHDYESVEIHSQWDWVRVTQKAIAAFKRPLNALMRKKERKKLNRRKAVKRYRLLLRDSLKAAWEDTRGILLSITAFAATAKLMALFGMTQEIALVIVDGLKDAPVIYAFFIPIIGALGSGLTGSTTTSMFLFARLQAKTAVDLGLVTATSNSVYEVTAAGILGATSGEIISPMNAVVISLLRGVEKRESDLIRDLLGIAMIWLFACCILSGIFIGIEGFID